tara:strand:- start:2298 stop:3482 length:1185 start_codon:yes stop_codon:yes gene_type:complete
LCNSKKLKKIYSFKKNPIGDDYTKLPTKNKLFNLDLNRCLKCKFVQLSNVIDPKKVYGEYLYVTKTSLGLQNHFYNLGKKLIRQKIVNQNSKILEIGSNDGTLLEFFHKKSSLIIGVDPAAHLFQNNNIKNIKGLFSYELSQKILKRYGNFDTIIANNVIANIDNLKDIFKGIDEILSKDGHLIIETFALYGILKNNLIDNIYHEHLSYFSIKTFQKFAKNYDLSLKSVEFLKVKGGSLRLIFQKKKIIKNRNVEKIINKENIILKNVDKKFKNLQKLNFDNKIKINKIIDKCLSKGLKIFGFGASVGTTTLVYDFELDKKIEYIFDNEKKRFNLYMPGTNIKVLNPNYLKKINVDYIIIFAWRYAKQILLRNKKLFSKKTKFVVPLPKCKIIK